MSRSFGTGDLFEIYKEQIDRWAELMRESIDATRESADKIEELKTAVEKLAERFDQEKAAKTKTRPVEDQVTVIRSWGEFFKTIITTLVTAILTIAAALGLVRTGAIPTLPEESAPTHLEAPSAELHEGP